jgi:hypothetical protein
MRHNLNLIAHLRRNHQEIISPTPLIDPISKIPEEWHRLKLINLPCHAGINITFMQNIFSGAYPKFPIA